jgi:hypothetical protein
MDRAKRRYLEEKHFNRRLKVHAFNQRYWRSYTDINGNRISNPLPSDYLGDSNYMKYKNIRTDKYGTKRKVKFSPNKSKSYYRDNKKLDTREYRNKEFFKILRDNGVK